MRTFTLHFLAIAFLFYLPAVFSAPLGPRGVAHSLEPRDPNPMGMFSTSKKSSKKDTSQGTAPSGSKTSKSKPWWQTGRGSGSDPHKMASKKNTGSGSQDTASSGSNNQTNKGLKLKNPFSGKKKPTPDQLLEQIADGKRPGIKYEGTANLGGIRVPNRNTAGSSNSGPPPPYTP